MRLERRAYSVLMVTAVLFGFASCETASTDRVLAEVAEVTGGVVLIGSTAVTHSVTLQVGANVGANQTIRTDADGHAIIALLPGMLLQLNGDTQVRVDHLSIAKSTHELSYAMRMRGARITLERGSICAVTPITVTPARLTITTAQGILTAADSSTFFVSSDGRISAERGDLVFTSKADGAAQTLRAGQSFVFSLHSGAAGTGFGNIDNDDMAGRQGASARDLEARSPELMELSEERNRRPPSLRHRKNFEISREKS